MQHKYAQSIVQWFRDFTIMRLILLTSYVLCSQRPGLKVNWNKNKGSSDVTEPVIQQEFPHKWMRRGEYLFLEINVEMGLWIPMPQKPQNTVQVVLTSLLFLNVFHTELQGQLSKSYIWILLRLINTMANRFELIYCGIKRKAECELFRQGCKLRSRQAPFDPNAPSQFCSHCLPNEICHLRNIGWVSSGSRLAICEHWSDEWRWMGSVLSSQGELNDEAQAPKDQMAALCMVVSAHGCDGAPAKHEVIVVGMFGTDGVRAEIDGCGSPWGVRPVPAQLLFFGAGVSFFATSLPVVIN